MLSTIGHVSSYDPITTKACCNKWIHQYFNSLSGGKAWGGGIHYDVTAPCFSSSSITQHAQFLRSIHNIKHSTNAYHKITIIINNNNHIYCLSKVHPSKALSLLISTEGSKSKCENPVAFPIYQHYLTPMPYSIGWSSLPSKVSKPFLSLLLLTRDTFLVGDLAENPNRGTYELNI